MTLKEHSKHTKLVKPVGGSFGRNEWAMVGAPCINIKLLSDAIISALSPKYKCAYADTSHNDEIISTPGRLAAGAVCEYTDQLNYQQFLYQSPLNNIQFKQQFAAADLVLVNGNHQPAQAQVVIIYPNKSASLQKRLHQLTNVQLILLADDADDVFDFVKEALPNWEQIPKYKFNDTEKIIAFFEKQLQVSKPALNGLVLAGGQSQRMGQDKGALNLYGKEQRYFLADALKSYCSNVFISCRSEQKEGINTAYNTLEDTFINLGPFGAILSAFRENPNAAWLVVACDLPLLDKTALDYLLANRNPSAIATAYKNGYDGFPEPLITIWEPKSYPVLLAYLAQGYSCPRKVLINSDTHLLDAPDIEVLTNVNTPEELNEVKRHIHQLNASS